MIIYKISTNSKAVLSGASQIWKNILPTPYKGAATETKPLFRGYEDSKPLKRGFLVLAPGLQPAGFLQNWDAPDLSQLHPTSFAIRYI